MQSLSGLICSLNWISREGFHKANTITVLVLQAHSRCNLLTLKFLGILAYFIQFQMPGVTLLTVLEGQRSKRVLVGQILGQL